MTTYFVRHDVEFPTCMTSLDTPEWKHQRLLNNREVVFCFKTACGALSRVLTETGDVVWVRSWMLVHW